MVLSGLDLSKFEMLNASNNSNKFKSNSQSIFNFEQRVKFIDE